MRQTSTPRRPASGSVLSLAILCRHVALRDPGKPVGCLYPVPSPTALAFDLLGRSRHFLHPPPSDFPWRSPFRGLTTVRLRYNLPTCSPPCRSRPCFRSAYGDFYIRASGGLVTRTAAGHHYSGNWASSTGGTHRFTPARTPTSIAATQNRTSGELRFSLATNRFFKVEAPVGGPLSMSEFSHSRM